MSDRIDRHLICDMCGKGINQVILDADDFFVNLDRRELEINVPVKPTGWNRFGYQENKMYDLFPECSEAVLKKLFEKSGFGQFKRERSD